MTTASLTQFQSRSLRRQLTGVAAAARRFADALFAAQGRQFVAQEVRDAQVVSPRAKAKARRQLFSLAKQYEAMSPNLSAELRSIAARD